MYDINYQEPPLPRQHPDFKRYLQILRRRKWIVLICLEVALAVVVLFNEFSAPVYEAVATIICETPKSNILPKMEQPSFDRSAMINLIEQLKSRTLTKELAQALPEQIIQALKASVPSSGNLSQDDIVIGKIQENLSVERVSGSDILQIKVTANDPQMAKIIANTYVEQIIDWNSQKRRNEISSTREFVEKQFAIFQDKLNTAEEALRVFKETNRMTGLSDASAEALTRITDAEAKYNEAKAERAALEQRLRIIQGKKNDLSPYRTVGSNSQIQQLKQRLGELETRQASLRKKGAKPEQPEMVSIKQAISRIKEQLIRQLENAAPVPSHQRRNLLEESITLEMNLETCKAKERGLKNILADYDKEIQALPKREVALARLIREREVSEKIYSMLLEKREELRIAEASKFGQVHLIDAARAPIAPVKPQKAKNLALGLFLGLSLGVGLALLIESLDTSLKSPADVEGLVNLPVLAAIPSIQPNGATARSIKSGREAGRSYAGRLLSQLDAGSHVSAAYRSLHIKFAMVNGSGALKSILVTSPNAAEGKTLTAINMAQAFARNGMKTLLVDCDLRRPMIHHVLGLDPEPGLSDVLQNIVVSIEKAAAKWPVRASAPENENLFIFPCGTLPPNPYELLNTQRMREVLAEFKRQYDVVILDSPPLMAVTDSVVLGSEVDGVCLVIKSGQTRQEAAIIAKRLLENSQTNIIGTILNDIDTKTVNEYYGASNHYIS
jgi:tyrosine-protein kinase Etk/Wzc